jgi:hypothetical protein
MDREPALLDMLKERGPISVRRLAALTGLPKRCINGALHGSKKTTKVESAPNNSRNTRPLWTWSETPVRPVKAVRNKTVTPPNEE